jgi:hypothetical protein
MTGVTPDTLAFVYSLIGSFCMGSYPVTIKTPAVLKLDMHPMVFQCYKSFWVFVLGFGFIALNLLRGLPAYVFTYWGILGAAAWIPSGLCTIIAVPRIGVGMTAVLNTGTAAALQFVVGQLLDEKMKLHGMPGHEYVLAPYFVLGVLFGMAGLVLVPTLRCSHGAPGPAQRLTEGVVQDDMLQACSEDGAASVVRRNGDLLIGTICATGSGFFAALQFGLISIGKKIESSKFDCSACPEQERFNHEFDDFGSYMTSFGIGTGFLTLVYLGAFGSVERCQGRKFPSMHFQTLRVPGSLAGWCWVCANVFQSAAVNRGGVSVMGPSNTAIQLLSSGFWGLLYYWEIRSPTRIFGWILCAVWTVTFVVLLGREKR